MQPAGWLFALAHHVPASTFENVVGNWFLDRDGQWLQVQSRGTTFDEIGRGYVAGGLAFAPPRTSGRVTGPVRLLLPMFAAEPINVRILGQIPAGTRAAAWNGTPVVVTDEPKGVRLSVPGTVVRAGANELALTLPVGATLDRIDFESTSTWWQKR